MTRCYWMYMVLWPSSWHQAHMVIQAYTYNHTIIHIQAYRYNHTDTIIQAYTYNHAMMLHTGMWRIPVKSSSNTKCVSVPVAHFCVHNSVPLLTKMFMDLRQATNMNSYIRNHCGLHNVTNCIWSSGRHDNIIRTLSYNHTHTIIQIQSYTYKHTHATMQWCCTQVCDAFPWKVVQTHNVQVFALHTFVFTIRCCCWQNCLWIWGKIVFESAASNQHELIHTQSLWITHCY